ncbi:hypothetical protein [Candidatus Odyssella thessalonicensis]|uniref:hypothetical protein n=1 Tax=Candidatus Odyssella thessalonicensis TaxID=84647 RepID=UPI000225AC0F|nr:hypothetical protein [Candidatus Odyssella thessalonicensis]
MSINVDRPFLGYAETREEAIQIIQDTGILCITIGIAYLIAFLSLTFQRKSFPAKSLNHIFTILIWTTIGAYMLIGPSYDFFSFKAVTWLAGGMFGLSFSNLWILCRVKLPQCDNIFIQHLQKPPTSSPPENQRSPKITFQNILDVSFINERILWLLILFRMTVTLRTIAIMNAWHSLP